MKKIKILIFLAAAISILTAACATNRVEYMQLCDAANKGKTVTVEGFIQYGNKTPCVAMMRRDMKRDCGFLLMGNMNVVGKEPIVYLREGKENNQAESPETGQPNVKMSTGFENEQVKYRLNDGTVINFQEDFAMPVTVTGEVQMNDGDEKSDRKCSLLAEKVEKR